MEKNFNTTRKIRFALSNRCVRLSIVDEKITFKMMFMKSFVGL